MNPFLYWDNNFIGSKCLIEVMNEFKCRTIVFSSSAIIYGETSFDLLDEEKN